MASREKLQRTEEEWKQVLSPEQYRVLREKGTERPFTGKYEKNKEKGVYVCAACGSPLFSSAAKYDSGSGWPSFYTPVAEAAVETHADSSFGMARTEVLCARCEGHLGHVFDDGPAPTGLRYCINSASLEFQPAGGEDRYADLLPPAGSAPGREATGGGPASEAAPRRRKRGKTG